ncbi:helix-turn-helix transcriptional regulator [Flavobacterium gawalongense]|uniref:Helix-turn-helix transcriptional regulator n=2 Tax=Flavobacterium gawalongense TaxID=2594432 RepID=A0A553BH35_9FLAO|nr:helix-turn-helix transcriptional regulator [Flavobacterium gawalongense]TRX04687.1 helix-turn-helix transcriptional regulator [Flavobacterium gawalongense]TRX07543.1 helix-turn-helix transcriptional regulator [Flavobacterium gawalongense]TRX12958.1 helix-turn-helix transcriptional regulator [Flavobacterium gawalongense]TRX31074.1 helix-turn-helix transcriptional regulator [Flavobacterium gawalongense]
MFIEASGSSTLPMIRNYPVHKSEIVFNLNSEPITAVRGDGIENTLTRSVLRGSVSVWEDIHHPKQTDCMIISFHPEVFHSLFQIPSSELTDQSIDGNLHKREFDEIWHQLIEAKSFQARLQIAEKWILNKIKHSAYKQNNIGLSVKEKCDNTPNITLKQLEKEIGYGRQHLFDEFKKHTGISIKKYQELLRFQMMMQTLKTNGIIDGITFAHENDFYDQAHMIKTFKKFTGKTPTEMKEFFMLDKNSNEKNLNLIFENRT